MLGRGRAAPLPPAVPRRPQSIGGREPVRTGWFPALDPMFLSLGCPHLIKEAREGEVAVPIKGSGPGTKGPLSFLTGWSKQGWGLARSRRWGSQTPWGQLSKDLCSMLTPGPFCPLPEEAWILLITAALQTHHAGLCF